jgi:hypothetical protein
MRDDARQEQGAIDAEVYDRVEQAWRQEHCGRAYVRRHQAASKSILVMPVSNPQRFVQLVLFDMQEFVDRSGDHNVPVSLILLDHEYTR